MPVFPSRAGCSLGSQTCRLETRLCEACSRPWPHGDVMSAAGERGETARTYGRAGMSADAPSGIERMLALQKDVAALVKENMGRAALLDDLYDRMARADAEAVKVQGMLKALGGRVLALENPTSEMDRAARGLAAFADKIDAATPGKVPAHEVAKAKAQAVK